MSANFILNNCPPCCPKATPSFCEWEDKQFYNIEKLISLLQVENIHQLQKWGIQKRSSFEWLAYLTEELGELAEAISENQYRQGSIEDIIKEAIQTATLALKIAEMNLERLDSKEITKGE